MQNSPTVGAYASATDPAHVATREAGVSGVSWGAVIAGAFAAAALSLVLLALGAGMGLTSARGGDPATTAQRIGVGVVVWMVAVQWLSAGMGGYLAGRLRTKWVGIHTDEVFFRDTSHGFLAWAVGVVISAMLLSSAVASVIGGGVQAASNVAGGLGQAAIQAAGQATGGGAADPSGYFVDQLFRSQKPAADANPQAMHAEVARIIAASIKNGDIAPDDKAYLAQLVAARTGLSQADAEKRVTVVAAKAKQAAADAAQKAKQVADAARKSAAYLAFATCLSLLIGAFIAGVAGALGGRQRDTDQGTPIAT